MTSESKREIDLGQWFITRRYVDEYLGAVGDLSTIYGDTEIVPPMALAAQVLGLLLEKLSLPPGTVHASQEVLSQGAIKVSQQVGVLVRVSRPWRRGEWELLTAEFTLNVTGSDAVLRGKTMVMAPAKE